MFQFLETIKISNNKPRNLEYHIQRMKRTCLYHFNNNILGNIESIINDYIITQNLKQRLVYKCRIIYTSKIESIEISEYNMNIVQSLKVKKCDDIDYSFKFLNREKINNLIDNPKVYDDILIVKKNVITDTSIHNVAFFDGNKYYTPKYPLLMGTKRENLIKNGLIYERNITLDRIHDYHQILLFNSMIEFGKIKLSINSIIN